MIQESEGVILGGTYLMYSLYELFAFFFIYAFLGWALEVAYHVISVGQVINRGFLNGPWCPIYGVGMMGILTLLQPLSPYPILQVLGGIIFATLIELIGGFVLFKLFHLRWWDYSKEPFNLGGYICLRFSLAWGLCIVFAIKFIHPVVALNVVILDNIFGYILIVFLCVVFAFDQVVTILSIMNLNKDLKRMNELAADIKKTSDSLTEKIGKRTRNAEVRVQEGRVQAALAKAEGRDRLESLQKELRDYMHTMINKHPVLQRLFGYERIRRAYPDLKHKDYDQVLQALKEGLKTGGKTRSLLDRLMGGYGDEPEEESMVTTDHNNVSGLM